MEIRETTIIIEKESCFVGKKVELMHFYPKFSLKIHKTKPSHHSG